MLSTILFIAGLILLIKGADFLVNGASSIAKKMNISDLVVGLTIVAFGTSAPELFVNIYASINGNTEIAIGNIVGSNICNILLILGISAIIYPLSVKKNTIWKEIPLTLLAAILILLMASDRFIDNAETSFISRIDGLVLIAFFVIFLYYAFSTAKEESDESDSTEVIKQYSYSVSALMILGGLIALVLGGKWMVDSAVELATYLGISKSVIGLTVVAIGTSLPELATSAMAAYKKKSDIAIGNVVGSNIFNTFWILGLSSFISPLPFSEINIPDLYVNILASLLLFGFLFIGKKHMLEKWQGWLFLLMYAGYIVYLFLCNA